MSIDIKTVEHLAGLARIEINTDDASSFTNDLNSIMGYVSEIDDISATSEKTMHTHINIVRDDIITNETGKYTEAIIKNAPNSNNGYVEVHQVL